MCGIAGIWSKKEISADEIIRICLQFSENLKHRGPDDEGFVLFDIHGNALEFGGNNSEKSLPLKPIQEAKGFFLGALIHRRLSIISPGPKGHQPMHSADGNFWLVYNGETFNYRDLDPKFGFENRSNTDSETVLNAMAANVENHQYLDGFHAFALHSIKENKLHLFRDSTGVKPLYYLQDQERFVFASETKALRKFAQLTQLNHKAVFHFLTEGIQIPGLELVKEIAEVKSRLVVDLKTMICREKEFLPTNEYPTHTLEESLERVVESRLLSDVPLGFALSGGLDSAIVAGIARKKIKTAENLKLFSVISNDVDTDESYWQKLLAKEWNGQWNSVNTDSFQSTDLEKIIRLTDLPPVAWNNIAQFELAALVKQHGVTVFLNGQGADEIFGGYPDYWIRYFRNHPMQFISNRKLPMSKPELMKEVFKSMMKNVAGKTNRRNQFIKKQNGWLGEALIENESWHWNRNTLDADTAMRGDYYGQRLRQMLRWEDLNGMANQLESRNPFADSQQLAQWLNVPLKQKFTNGYSKGILRDAVTAFVPDEVRMRIDKKGFSVPDGKLTLKHMHQWKDAYFSETLNIFSPMAKREQAFKSVNNSSDVNLKWIFRLASLSYFMEQIKSE